MDKKKALMTKKAMDAIDMVNSIAEKLGTDTDSVEFLKTKDIFVSRMKKLVEINSTEDYVRAKEVQLVYTIIDDLYAINSKIGKMEYVPISYKCTQTIMITITTLLSFIDEV